jgi:hypothetical protein
MVKPLQRGMVPAYQVVRVVSVDFLTQLEMLLADGLMSMELKLLCDALHAQSDSMRSCV